MPVCAQHAALEVAARMADQYLFDEVGVIYENVAKIDHTDSDDIPVGRQLRKHFQRALLQRAKGPAFEPVIGAGGKFVATPPHTTMLSRGFARVNASECSKIRDYCARKARIRKPPLRDSIVTLDSPAASNLLGAVAGSSGTNVLLIWPTR